jgi:hypothetical protein
MTLGHQTESLAHSRDGIANLADYTHQFAEADTKIVRPVNAKTRPMGRGGLRFNSSGSGA